ncbi:LptA/OstA family protein [Asaia astilbis]|uniref:LptA/OstA family protein n=1 Tax=Asaia astilbis TaxID=610244 RepID=UPI0004715D2A|nr:LptA/OstA family protein [Asaia astilbis]
MRRLLPALTLSSLLMGLPLPGASFLGLSGAQALAQSLDMSHGEQVNISSAGPQTYDHDAQTVTFVDRARAVRGDVTIDADQLIGFLRKKAPDPNAPPPPPSDQKADGQKSDSDEGAMGGSMELYRMEAIGHVHIYTSTDQAWGDKALYDIDQAVLVMTGKALKLTTPQDVLTARDVMEYHANTRMSVGRGDATVTTNDGKRIKGDVLVAFSKPDNATPAPSKPAAGAAGSDGTAQRSSKLDRAYAWGHVMLRTPNETATGDRGVYVFDTQMARLIGHVHVTSGQNQNNGASAIVNMKTGVAIMNPAPGQRVEGMVIPNEASSSKPGDKHP